MNPIDWQMEPFAGGGRSVERPWIIRRLAGVQNSVIVDYGCIDNHDSLPTISTDAYGIDPSNQVTSLDSFHARNLAGRYLECDILTATIAPNSVDVGICVSVIEHIGTPQFCFGSESPWRDLMALMAMTEHLKRETGVLYLTFPIGPLRYIHHKWIRIYTVSDLKMWRELLPELEFSCDLFKLIKGRWNECDPEDLHDVTHYEKVQDITAIAALTVKWKK